ncbi:hypothetical protein DMA11_23615 [Marinilabiliaceae bacterium JC017]|nr:hypothetical protein DMA11_23615 [Marinilabiliaceae bacterium JC017]
MKKHFITLISIVTLVQGLYAQSGNPSTPPGPALPPRPTPSVLIMNLDGPSGSLRSEELSLKDNQQYQFNIDAGSAQRVVIEIVVIDNQYPGNTYEIFETDDGFSNLTSMKRFYYPSTYRYESYQSNGKLVLKIKTGGRQGGPQGRPNSRNFRVDYSTSSEPLNDFSQNSSVTIGAHTQVPNLTVSDPVYKSMGDNLFQNNVLWDNANLLLKSGANRQLGFDANNICSSSGLSLTAKESDLKLNSDRSLIRLNSVFGFDFSLKNKPSVFKIYHSGNIGINNPSTTDALINGKINGKQWEGYLNFSDSSGDYGVNIGNGGGALGNNWFPSISGRTIDRSSALYLLGDYRGTSTGGRGILVLDGRFGNTSAPATQKVIEFRSGYDNRLGHITGDGSLVMKGTIKAKAVKVTAQTADFVFEEDYNLRTLKEVEQFIRDNKHLPDIPSAAQMEEDGVNVAEMNKLLLQKIEELTLYTISQEKQLQGVETLRKENEGLKAEVNKIRKLHREEMKKMERELAAIKALLLRVSPNP